MDVGVLARRVEHRRVRVGIELGPQSLDDERGAVAGAERPRERLDRAERVLARGHAAVVERETREPRLHGSPSDPRSIGATSGVATGIGIRTTGTGDTAARASATKREPAQTSSIPSNPRAHAAGNDATSHHHRPTTAALKGRRPARRARRAAVGVHAHKQITGCGADAAPAGERRGWTPAAARPGAAALGAPRTWRAASPTPSGASSTRRGSRRLRTRP